MHVLKAALAATVAFAATATFFLSGSPASAADEAHTLSIRLAWLPSGYQSPYFLAEKKGWYKAAGLDVTLTQGTGSAISVQLVGTGQYDAGEAALSDMAFGRGKGMPVISIAGFLRKGDLTLLVPADSPMHSPADLKGKKLIYSAGSLETPFLDPFFAAGGLTRDQIDLLNLDPSAKMSSYVAGKADGVFGTASFSIPIADRGRPSRSLLFADFGLALPSLGIITTEAKLKQKGPALRAFASVVAGAWTYILAHHESEAIDATIETHPQDRLNKALLLDQLKVALGFLYTPATEHEPIGVQAAADWTEAIGVMEKAKTIPPGTKPAEYFTNDYLDLKLIKSIGASS